MFKHNSKKSTMTKLLKQREYELQVKPCETKEPIMDI
jgi:hypothetical protein